MNLPDPDHTRVPRFVPELQLIELVYSDDGYARVAITQNRQRLYCIYPERWDVSDFTVIGEGYWNSWGGGTSITDDIEIARTMAREVVGTIPRSKVIPNET